MASIWKLDGIPKDNTLEKELERLKRIALALEIAVLEDRKKHVLRDIKEMRISIEELERLMKDRDEDE